MVKTVIVYFSQSFTFDAYCLLCNKTKQTGTEPKKMRVHFGLRLNVSSYSAVSTSVAVLFINLYRSRKNPISTGAKTETELIHTYIYLFYVLNRNEKKYFSKP